MKTLFVNCLILINFINMNAQEYEENKKYGPRDEKYPIELSEKYTIYQQNTNIKDKDITIRKLFLKKEGEMDVKLLDEIKVEKNTVKPTAFVSKNMAIMINQEIIMRLPKLIDAYKEGQQIYVFLYKNRNATLQIYDFEDGINFKKDEYSLIPVDCGSVANFGGYKMTVSKKRDKKDTFCVRIGRSLGGG